MALDTPNPYQPGPGGPAVTAWNGINALVNNLYETKYNKLKTQYAPLTIPAKGLSEMAYAQFVAPQFVAKLLGNSDIAANMDPNLRNDLLKSVSETVKSGMGTLGDQNQGQNQSSGLNSIQQLQNQIIQLRNALHLPPGQSQPQPPQQNQPQPIPQQPNLSSQDQQKIESMQPGDSYVVQGKGADSGYSYDKNGDNIRATPQQIDQAANPSNKDKYFENIAWAKGIEEEGKVLGKKRGEAISAIGKQYLQDVEGMVPLDRLMDISQSPIFMNMRNNIPGFQQLQLKTLKNFTGTPAQQRMIGDFITSAQSVVGNTVLSFGNKPLVKEFDYAKQLKINENDNINVILGKLESLATFKEATMKRDRIASDLMTKKHMNEGDAYEMANKKVDMKGIREKISNRLQSPVRVRNKRTNETKYISPTEYNDLLDIELRK